MLPFAVHFWVEKLEIWYRGVGFRLVWVLGPTNASLGSMWEVNCPIGGTGAGVHRRVSYLQDQGQAFLM